MANPRNLVAFDGIGALYVTYETNNTIVFDRTKVGGSEQVGLAVTLSGDGEVGLVGDGEEVEGRLERVEADDKAVVQVAGYMKLPAGTGAALSNGKKIVGDLLSAAEGYIREVATGTAGELGLARGAIIDNSVTTAVVVRL